MWVIRSLNGPLAGKKFELKSGSTRLGRLASCDIVIPHQGISKEHTEVVIEGNTVMIRDLNSSNGVFVNGVRVQTKKLNPGDKIGLYDLLFDVAEVRVQKKVAAPKVNVIPFTGQNQAHAPQSPSAPTWDQGHPVTNTPPQTHHAPPNTFADTAKQYIENVVLPGVYALGNSTEFRWVIGGFVAGFIALVTTLSVIPMIQITKTSVERESQKRALTIASSLADRYLRAVQDGNVAQFSVESASREEGVDDAFIISSEDGRVLAPAKNAGTSPDKPFIHSARKSDKKL
ncbi:MAG: FHA domain-containing protein, partial [Bdellovibrionales bacterium]|nr:FHA domain-containing protein [Bdellovibrionales bacterium]